MVQDGEEQTIERQIVGYQTGNLNIEIKEKKRKEKKRGRVISSEVDDYEG